ncbi:MAG: YibE/F family protein [Oscillospiraceae bacterium]|nr:YibE/F family protein [Oscillospiraceae bacterium]
MKEDKVKLTDLSVFLIVSVITIVFIIVGYHICKMDDTDANSDLSSGTYYKAKIESITKTTTGTDDTSYQYDDSTVSADSNVPPTKTIYFKATILNGPDKGTTVDGTQVLDYTYGTPDKEVTQGNQIIISPSQDPDSGATVWTMISYNKINYLVGLLVVFLVILIIIGRLKGFTTIIALIYSTVIIFTIYIPSILKGYNIYLSTTIVAVFIIFMSMLIINGANKKTWGAIIGNIGGVAIAGLLGLLANKVMGITGMVDENSMFLKTYNNGIDLVGVVWGGIVIGSLGAIMDISMTIASAMHELSETMKNKTFGDMLRSGMNIGKDAIGTMTNTLVLAYIGSSLAVVLLLMAYSRSSVYLFNMEMIMVQIIQAVVGSIGILFAVPITALFAARIYNKDD